jgi:hypothetical protein
VVVALPKLRRHRKTPDDSRQLLPRLAEPSARRTRSSSQTVFRLGIGPAIRKVFPDPRDHLDYWRKKNIKRPGMPRTAPMRSFIRSIQESIKEIISTKFIPLSLAEARPSCQTRFQCCLMIIIKPTFGGKSTSGMWSNVKQNQEKMVGKDDRSRR